MELFWKLLTNAVLIVHSAWILAVIFGPLICWFFPKFRIFHITMIFITVLIMLSGYLCPLTYLENWLKVHYDPALTYQGGFIINYLERFVYMDVSPKIIFFLTLFWGIIWLPIYKYFRKKGDST